MLKLNRSRDFGTIAPPWQEDDMDRPAHYEQDGNFFDAHDRQIIRGQELVVAPPPAPPAEQADDTEDDDAPMSASALLQSADSMPWNKFAAEAKRVLGPKCPRGKQAIVIALEDAIKAYEKRKAKRHVEVDDAAPAPAPVPVSDNKSGVDLAAWARGQRQYLFGDVVKAMRTTYSVQFAEGRDILDFLVDQGVIQAAEARNDV